MIDQTIGDRSARNKIEVGIVWLVLVDGSQAVMGGAAPGLILTPIAGGGEIEADEFGLGVVDFEPLRVVSAKGCEASEGHH
jgi:hypothetical protein